MKIVIFTHYLKGGGAEKRASIFANYLYEQGIDVSLVLMHKVEEEYPTNENIKKYYIANSKNEYQTFSKKKRLNLLTNLLEDIKPDKIISFLTVYGLYAVLAKKKSKILKDTKLIYGVSLYQRKYHLKSRLIDFLSCLFSDFILLQCKEQIKCNKLFKKKCHVIYNPIEDRWNKLDLNRSFESLSVISVGRLDRQKNFELTIHAIDEIHKKHQNITLDIYGDGKKKNKLNKLINKLHAIEYIKIHPFSFEIEKEYLKHNVYISSSRYEGFPNSLVEAMMSGLLCLSTPCPTGPKEIIYNNENGILFKNKKILIDKLKELIKDQEKCLALSEKARESALNNFETNKSLKPLLDILNK